MAGNSAKFWQTRDAWQSAHQKAYADKATALRASPLVRNESLWNSRGKRYMRKYTSLPTDIIRVDPRLFEVAERLMEQVAPQLAAAYDEHLGGLALRALDEWPVHTGLSKTLLSLEYTADGNGEQFRGTVRSGAPYTVFIEGQPHRKWIERPASAVAERILDAAMSEIVRTQ